MLLRLGTTSHGAFSLAKAMIAPRCRLVTSTQESNGRREALGARIETFRDRRPTSGPDREQPRLSIGAAGTARLYPSTRRESCHGVLVSITRSPVATLRPIRR